MADLGNFLALFGVLFLAVAILAWWRILRKPDAVPPTKKNDQRSESAAMVIVIAFLLSAVGAVLAIIAWIRG